MFFAKNPDIVLQTCEICKGTGSSLLGRCRACRGMGVWHTSEGVSVYFGTPLTLYHVALRRGRRLLNHVRIIFAFAIALGATGWFGFLVYRNDWLNDILSADFWLRTVAYGKIWLWIGVIAIGYLAYRVGNGGGKEKEIPLSPKKKIDIAEVATFSARAALEDAFMFAKKQGRVFTPLHLFYSLFFSTDVASIFLRLGIAKATMQKYVGGLIEKHAPNGAPKATPELYSIIFNAYEIARGFRDTKVKVTELLIATVRQSELLQEMLYDMNIDRQKLVNVIEWVRVRERLRDQYHKLHHAAAFRSKYGIDRAMTAVATPYLNQFSEDLTLAAKFGYLTPCVARDTEIEEIFRIIEGGRQSVILVGAQGVGKMSVIEGIAQRMVEENVPVRLKDKRLVQLSTSSLLAGTTVNGALDRLLKIMHEVGRAGNIILFIKNLHDLVGITDSGGGGVDVSESLAEFLGPSKSLLFATTTTEGYNQTILNSSVGKVLAQVAMKEMDHNQAIQVLESKVGATEYKHHVFFSYDALEACVTMAERFLRDQNLPESAIGLMAEAASYVRSKKGENQLVDQDDVGAVVGQKTGVPATSITEDESEKLLRLEEEMHKRVIGQDEAVTLVANALRRARAEIRSQKRPIANFLFLGPTGVGKTELAKTIATVYFGGENRMIRVDMSEYQDTASIYRLIGEPGKQGTGQLTEAVRQHPFSLVLLDELEKADKDVMNLFLQVFDDGRLTDSVGRVIDFSDTIIIATSNAATSYVQDQVRAGVALDTIREQLVRSELKQYYAPEFLNRFDGIVLFKPLDREGIKQIASLMLKRVAKDLEARGVELRVESSALDALAEVGFDPDFGARPMRRAIQDKVENQLAELVLKGELKRRDVVVLGEGAALRVERTN